MKNKNYLKKVSLFNVETVKKFAAKFLWLSIAFCSVYFIVCVNDIAIKGFVIKDLKMKVAELSEENKEIKLRVYDLKSLENISARAREMKMVKVDKIDYITIINGAVALGE